MRAGSPAVQRADAAVSLHHAVKGKSSQGSEALEDPSAKAAAAHVQGEQTIEEAAHAVPAQPVNLNPPPLVNPFS
jgi:hypothetical protein